MKYGKLQIPAIKNRKKIIKKKLRTYCRPKQAENLFKGKKEGEANSSGEWKTSQNTPKNELNKIDNDKLWGREHILKQTHSSGSFKTS